MEKDHLEILLEDIRDKIKLVLQGQTALIHEMQDFIRKSEERLKRSTSSFEVHYKGQTVGEIAIKHHRPQAPSFLLT
ncbi:MAG: hypothetical protein KAW01_05500 [Deltaproteobacteria bacterium]|nr:hypothetical protein [Deltaproteobacteria bacterium]